MATLAVTFRQKWVIEEQNKRKTIKTWLYKVWLHCQRHVLQLYFLSDNLIFIAGNTLKHLWIQSSCSKAGVSQNIPVGVCLVLTYGSESWGIFMSKEFYYRMKECFYRLPNPRLSFKCMCLKALGTGKQEELQVMARTTGALWLWPGSACCRNFY